MTRIQFPDRPMLPPPDFDIMDTAQQGTPTIDVAVRDRKLASAPSLRAEAAFVFAAAFFFGLLTLLFWQPF